MDYHFVDLYVGSGCLFFFINYIGFICKIKLTGYVFLYRAFKYLKNKHTGLIFFSSLKNKINFFRGREKKKKKIKILPNVR